jgi:branched-chain amino acid transport system permease protein
VGTLSAIIVDAASFTAWLFLVAVGLTLIFGVLRLLNIAHGAFYSVGAYAGVYAIGASVALGWGTALQLASALAVACVIGALIGLLVERYVLHRLYGHAEPLVLIATYALFLVLDDLTKLISGGRSLYAAQPRDSFGQIGIGGLQYPLYDVIAVSLAGIELVRRY